MQFELIKSSGDYKESFRHLMQLYIYDFSEFIDLDVEEDGLFKDHQDVGEYWKETDTQFPYIVKKDNKLIGFVLVKAVSPKPGDYSMAEFFIMKKYRREGIGRAVAMEIFNIHKGQWEVHQRESNKPAQNFWSKVINEYTNGRFLERAENGRTIQTFQC